MLRLVSFTICPFVQRSRILLNEKGVSYDIEYIDLENKPEWFLKRVPTGRVPALFIGDSTLFESAAINEYIDETQGEPILDSDPIARARQRALITFSEAMLIDQYRMLIASEQSEYENHKKNLFEKLEKLNNEGVTSSPESLTLFDAAIAPVFFRLQIIPRLKEELLERFAEQPAMIRWIESLMTRKSVRESVGESFNMDFNNYFSKRGSVALTL